MRAAEGGGGGETIVVDIPGVRAASTKVGEAGQAFAALARRIAGHPLPDMPASTAAVVEATLADAASVLGPLPRDLIAAAQELGVRALWAEIADRLMAGYGLSGSELDQFKAAYASGLLNRYAEPWQRDLADAYAKKLHDEEHPGGFAGLLHDAGSFFDGAWDAIKDPATMIYHLTPFSGGDWTKSWSNLAEGLAHGVEHPLQFAEAIANIDALKQRGFAYWIGNLAPAAAATLLSGGAAAAARGAESVTLVDRAGAGAADLERLESAAARAGRFDYSSGFSDSLENFEGEKALLHQGKLSRDLHVVQYFDGADPNATNKWWTPTSEANRMSTVDDVHQRLALLPEWGTRNTAQVAVIPRGTPSEFLYGRAAAQEGRGITYAGQGLQIRFRDFDPKWIRETRPLP